MWRSRCRIDAALLIALLTASTVAAQDAAQPTPPRFNADVVVTPERAETPRALVPVATSVLDSGTLLTLPTVNFGNVVSFLPGFSASQSEFYAGRPVVSARGFFGGGEAEYVLLLVDGVPITDAETGLIDWSAVPSSSIGRVEAARGPGASMYGDSAVAGVLQVFTDRSQGLRANVTGGSFGTAIADGTYGHRFGQTGMTVSAITRRTSGFASHAGAHDVVGSGSADGKARSVVWRWNAGVEDRYREDAGANLLQAVRADPTVSDPVYRFDDALRRQVDTSFQVEHPGNSRTWALRAYADSRRDDAIRTILLAPSVPDRQQRITTAKGFGGSADAGVSFGARGLALQFGSDLRRDNVATAYHPVNTGGIPLPGGAAISGDRLRTGAFASSSWQGSSRLRLTGAMRWDRVRDGGFAAAGSARRNHDAWSPRIGATVHATDAGKVSAFVQFAKAFKVPTVDQLFDPRPYPDFRGGKFTISTSTLRPQRATNVEAGVTGSSGITWSVVAYRMAVEDEIDFDIRTFSYGNIGRSRHAGLELEGSRHIASWFQPSVEYALTRVTDAESDLQLKNVPRHTFVAAASLDLPWRLGVYARYRRATRAFFDDANRVPIEGPATVDVRVRRAIAGQTIFVDAVNLFDDRYEEYGYTLTDFAGRVVPYAYPGAPRALRAGVSLTMGGKKAGNP